MSRKRYLHTHPGHPVPKSTTCTHKVRANRVLTAAGVLPARAPWSARDARERSAVARLRRRWNAHSGLSVMACLCRRMRLFRPSAS